MAIPSILGHLGCQMDSDTYIQYNEHMYTMAMTIDSGRVLRALTTRRQCHRLSSHENDIHDHSALVSYTRKYTKSDIRMLRTGNPEPYIQLNLTTSTNRQQTDNGQLILLNNSSKQPKCHHYHQPLLQQHTSTPLP